jgi:hypothetical protein
MKDREEKRAFTRRNYQVPIEISYVGHGKFQVLNRLTIAKAVCVLSPHPPSILV